MKKILYYGIIVVVLAGLVAGLSAVYLHSYEVHVYKKRTSQFLKQLSESKAVENQTAGDAKTMSLDDFDYRKVHPYCGFKAMASVDAQSRTGPVHIVTNSLGQRSPELAAEKREFRIAIVGGSVAFQGTTNEDAIIARLARLFQDAGVPTAYINASTLSFISNQELAVLVQDLLDEKPDLVISFDGYNDIQHIMYYNGRVGWPPMRWDNLGAEQTKHMNQTAASYYPLIRPELDATLPDRIQGALDNYLSTVEKMATICQAFGIKYLACLQPYRDFKPALCREHQSVDNEMGSKDYFFCQAETRFAEWEKARKHGAAYVSLLDCFHGEKEKRFTDECHFDDQANALVAKRLFDILREQFPGLVPTSGN
ncbi:hypothetical protein JCM15519_26490 [Fundidesulfovibrio butyratiphilus]